MPNTSYPAIAHQLQQLFTQHYGEFRPTDFLAVATELGFQLSPLIPPKPIDRRHNQQQPGAGYWATAPGAADISEGMVWVSTEPELSPTKP